MFTIHNGARVLLIAAALSTLSIDPLIAQHENHTVPVAPATPVDVTGIILCADGPQLPGAVIQVYRSNQAQPVASALSDQTGRFRVRVPHGSYTVRVTYLGHASAAAALVIEAPTRQLTMEPLRLQVNAVELEALVAVAGKERVRLQTGAVTYDVKGSAAGTTGTVAEALRNVPGLEIDATGSITLRGNSGVLVLLNGRRTSLKGDALIAFLKQMPAAALEKIEVVATPSAQQEADGNAGVVNLQFSAGDAEPATDAFAFSLSAASARQFMGALSRTGAVGRLNWEGLYSVSSLRPHTSTETERINALNTATANTSVQTSHADARHTLHSILTGAAWRIDGEQQLHGRFGYSWMRGAFDNSTAFDERPNAGVAFMRSSLEHTMPNADASLGWSLRSDRTRHLRFDAELRYARAGEAFNGRYAEADGSLFLHTDMSAQRTESTGKLDGAVDLGQHRIQFGYFGQTRTIEADYLADRADMSSQGQFAHRQDVHALYGTVAHALRTTFLTAGVRAERTSGSVELNNAGRDVAARWQLFPSLSLHWPHESSRSTEYQLSYARRITRPDATALNPYSMGEDDMNSFIGNPLLQPEIADQMELSMVRHGAVMTVQLAPYLRYVSQPVRPIKAVTESGRATTSLQNLRDARSAGVDISVKSRVGDAVAMVLSSNVSYAETRGAQLQSAGLYTSLRGTMDVRVGPATSLQFYGSRRSAQTIEQGEMDAAWTSDIAVLHRFGGADQGIVTLRVSDPFNTDRIAFRVGDATFTQRSERKITTRMLLLSMSWAVGGARAPETPHTAEKTPQIF
jgi:outer membrane receptor protein involved in Fe transport